MRQMPEVIRTYFEAHDAHDTEAALASFAPDAMVKDDGNEYRGTAAIHDWLARASVEFTYTRTLIDATELDTGTWLVANHLEGNFPGGVVDLRYRFVIRNELIAELDISP